MFGHVVFSLVAFMLVSSTVFVRIRTQTFLENEIVLSLLWKMAGHGSYNLHAMNFEIYTVKLLELDATDCSIEI